MLLTTQGFLSLSGEWLGYIVNVIFFLGGIASAITFLDKRHRKQQAKRDSDITDIVEETVAASIAKVMETVDSAVDKGIQGEIGDIRDTVKEIRNETRYNGGSSMKDSQRRTEATLATVITSLEAIHIAQVAQKEILKGQKENLDTQREMIGKIDQRQDHDSQEIAGLGKQMSNHMGWHAGKGNE